MKPQNISRRQFLGEALGKTAAVATGTAIAIAVPLPGAERAAKEGVKLTATDVVPLGKTGCKICRLGMGTGSSGGRIQWELGQEGFTKVIRYGYERGVRYIDTADAYRIHEMVGKAIKGLDRDKLWIQSKIKWNGPLKSDDPLKTLERFRKELGVDYIDSVLIHCVTTSTWDSDLKAIRDALSEAKEKKIIRLKGTSAHGLPGLRRSSEVGWCDLNLVRVNPQGRHCDGKDGTWGEPGNVPKVLDCIEKIHNAGRGVIGMKIIGNGDFKKPEDREKSIRFTMSRKDVDAVVIGFKSPAEIDEAIERMNKALAARHS